MSSGAYRRLRKIIGTQAEAAELLGVSRVTIIGREKGDLTITGEAALAVRCLATHVNSRHAAFDG